MSESASVSDPCSAWFERRRALSFGNRSLSGPVFYFLAMLITAWFGGLLDAMALVVAQCGIVYAVLLAFRLLYRHKLKRKTPRLPWWNAWLAAAIWSGWCLALIARDAPDIALWMCGMATVAFGSATAAVFSISFRNACILIVLQYVPMLVALFAGPAPHQAIAVVLTFFGVYLMLQIAHFAREYQHQLENEWEIQAARLALERTNREDSHTGLFNRRHFNDQLLSLWQQARRLETDLTVILLDIDHFKDINERFGHATGDQALKLFADALREQFRRATDYVFRIGGQEFAVLLLGSEAHVAHHTLQNLRSQLQQAQLPGSDADLAQLRLQFSAGVANRDSLRDIDAEATYQAAERALQHAKQMGSDRVLFRSVQ